eukprot:SAG11_NODE_3854_length_2190_cov_1.791487_1_plen_176_part_00
MRSPVDDVVFLREVLGPGKSLDRQVRENFDSGQLVAVVGHVSLPAGPRWDRLKDTIRRRRRRRHFDWVRACCSRHLRVHKKDTKASHGKAKDKLRKYCETKDNERFCTKAAVVIPPKDMRKAAAMSTKAGSAPRPIIKLGAGIVAADIVAGSALMFCWLFRGGMRTAVAGADIDG